jgi:hypothetical protein
MRVAGPIADGGEESQVAILNFVRNSLPPILSPAERMPLGCGPGSEIGQTYETRQECDEVSQIE